MRTRSRMRAQAHTHTKRARAPTHLLAHTHACTLVRSTARPHARTHGSLARTNTPPPCPSGASKGPGHLLASCVGAAVRINRRDASQVEGTILSVDTERKQVRHDGAHARGMVRAAALQCRDWSCAAGRHRGDRIVCADRRATAGSRSARLVVFACHLAAKSSSLSHGMPK